MKFTAAGDVLVQRRVPEDYDGFRAIKRFIEQGDARFFNLETTLNYEGECYGSQFSGGTYVRTNPECLDDMLDFGFNMTSFNNNHAMDFAHDGLIKTIEYLDAADVVHGGVGMNLSQASAPVYLETPNGRVALIAVNTSFNPAMMAGEQSRRVMGRPGINGLRVLRRIILPREDFDNIIKIADGTNINATKNINRADGYELPLPDGVCELGDMLFELGDEYGIRYSINSDDMARVKKAIDEALVQSDYIMISVHSHQNVDGDKEIVPEFLKDFCHFCIDNGADAVVGHGPHLLRPIEVYRDKPIFYSLGDFVIQLYNVPLAPEDFYCKYGMTSDSSVSELLKKRSAGFTRGLMEDVKMLETVVPYWETDGRKLKSLCLMPVKAAKGNGKHLEGLPQPAVDREFIKRLNRLSQPYGVSIEMKDGIAVCKW